MSEPALSRATVDRDGARRDDAAGLAADWEQARVLVVDDRGRAAVTEGDAGPELLLVGPDQAPDGLRCYLGRDEDGPVFAVPGRTPRGLGTRPLGLREVGALLPARDAGLLVHAVGLLAWHETHAFCPRCGAPTEADRGGSVRRCTAEGSEQFPRTDPAVIVLVHDGADRCVLGRQTVWPPGRYSTLAGFVEPGESAEAAVVREVAEESGVLCRDVTYRGSQPWPFPRSLMLGFWAVCDPDAAPRPADGELADVRWWTREQVLAAGGWDGRDAELMLPGEVSIAHHLIQSWARA